MVAAGGNILDAYGLVNVVSPCGLPMRGIVGISPDPIMFVAINCASVQKSKEFYQQLGFVEQVCLDLKFLKMFRLLSSLKTLIFVTFRVGLFRITHFHVFLKEQQYLNHPNQTMLCIWPRHGIVWVYCFFNRKRIIQA